MNLRIGVVCGLAIMLLPGMGLRSPTAAAAEAKAEFVPVEKQRVAKANHNPVAGFQGDTSKAVTKMQVAAGQRVNLRAAGTHDPDGDSVSSRWFVYKEAGTFRGDVRIEDATSSQAWFLAPRVSEPVSLHVILQVWDDGQPCLCSYRRIIVTVERK
jgi:hypothetical protein